MVLCIYDNVEYILTSNSKKLGGLDWRNWQNRLGSKGQKNPEYSIWDIGEVDSYQNFWKDLTVLHADLERDGFRRSTA